MRYIFMPFSKYNPHLFLSLAFEPSKCEYWGLLETSIEKRFSKKHGYEKINKCIRELWFSLKSFRSIKKEDICILWGFNRINIYIGILARLTFSRKRFLNINLLDHTRGGAKLKVKKIIYTYIFKNRNFCVSVNCEKEKERVIQRYKTNQNQIFVLPDCDAWNWDKKGFTDGEGYVFCGGNLRDWSTFFDAAKLLPEIRFVAVGGSAFFTDEMISDAPHNVKIYRDIPINRFSQLLADSRISVIAVPSSTPNGLTLIYQSAYLHRPIVATDIEAINNLLYSDETGLWGGINYSLGDANDLANKIRTVFYDYDKRKQLTDNMEQNLAFHTPEAYSNKILEFCDNYDWK